MNLKLQESDKAFIVESFIFVKEVYVIKLSGGFSLVKYSKKWRLSSKRIKAFLELKLKLILQLNIIKKLSNYDNCET